MKRDIREAGRIILAHGEVTGHNHEILLAETETVPTLEQAQFFELDGRRELVTLAQCVLRHQEHGAIALDPVAAQRGAELLARGETAIPIPGQYRQGDVLLHPIGYGAWLCIGQREQYQPDAWRQVAD